MGPQDEPAAGQPDPFAGWRYGAPEPPAEPAAQTATAAPEQLRVSRGRSSRRVATIVGAGSLAALAAVLALTLGGGGSPLAPATPVTRAAYVTASEPGYRVAMSIDETVAGRPLSFSAQGSFSTGAQPQGSMTVLAPGGISISELVVGPDLFMQLPGAAGAALAPTPWVEAKLAALTGASGFNLSTTGPADPSQELDLLRSAGQVTAVGGETVRGVATTHYHAVIDLNRYASVVPPSLRTAALHAAAVLERVTGQSTLAADVWVDRHGLVRRLALDLSVCSSVGTVDATLNMELYDFGRQPAVSAPPAGEVTDVTSTLASQVAQSTQQLGCQG
jgi:hypothetical protein